MAEVRSISGSCSCGNIQWTSTSAPEHLDYCYCLTCQKCSGAPFMAWMGVPKASLKWTFTQSEPFMYRSAVGDTDISVAERACCGSCGCNISLQYFLYHPEKTHVAASTTTKNDFEQLRVGCHIWTKHVPAWHTIPEDGIERHQEFDGDFQAKLDNYLKQGQCRAEIENKGGWWAGMLPADAPDYSNIKGPDTLTMADLWEDPSKVRRPVWLYDP